VPMAHCLKRWMRRFLKRSVKLILKFPGYVDSDTARVTFQTPGSLEQKSLLQKITNDLKMFSIQTTKKDLNRLKG